MKKLHLMSFKLVIIVQILAITLLTACTLSASSTICHATGDLQTPYNEISVNSTGLNEHRGHTNDIIPAPDGGCPAGPLVISTSDGNIAICHATGFENYPYNEITVNVNGLDGHDKHAGDIIPAPEGGCPSGPAKISITDDKVSICHATNSETNPYDMVTVSINGLEGHGKHVGDIIPAPEGGCPTSPLVVADTKVTICHATNIETNPYNILLVSVNGLDGHGAHEGDIIPAPKSGCPTNPVKVVDSNITICHATNIETNPYNIMTVSANGLDGHGVHEGDIIPAPNGGCPTSPLVIADGKITICHATNIETNPYDAILVSINGLDGHGAHAGDIFPAPKGGCPTSPLIVTDGNFMICHATNIESNPYNIISVNLIGLDGHATHEGDIFPAPLAGCPVKPGVINNGDGKITICHATNSKKNPYNEITVSINGLNGHDKHKGDIIPAPGGGCPGGKK